MGMGLNISEQLDIEFNNFIKLTDMKLINNSIDNLYRILENPIINEDNKRFAESLLIRMAAKYNIYSFIEDKFANQSYERIKGKLVNAMDICEKNKYTATLSFVSRCITLVENINDIFKEFSLIKQKIMDIYGNRATKSIEECKLVVDFCESKLKDIENVKSFNPFEDGVAFINLKAYSIEMLNRLKEKSLSFIEDINESIVDRFIEDNAEILTDTFKDKYEYCPIIDFKTRGFANTLVVSTPFYDEAKLAAYYIGVNEDRKFVAINGYIFNGENNYLDIFINAFKRKNLDVIILGVNEINIEIKNKFLVELINYSKLGHYVMVVDEIGDKSIYNHCIKLCEETDGLSKFSDVSHTYLAMPNYNDVIDLFRIKNMLKDENEGDILSKISDNFALMGYIGLNKIINDFIKGGNWIDSGKFASAKNDNEKLRAYLKKIPSQLQLIDSSWGDFEAGQDYIDEDYHIDYDYDSIRLVNPRNIKKIMDGDFTVMAKCGLIVRYCLLAGDDQSAWEKLTREEMTERMTLATELVYVALGLGYKPVVEVTDPNDEGWGGLCCNGGKLIKYRYDCIKSYEYASGVICHECHHSFQHYAIDHTYNPIWWNIHGLTINMVEQWRHNLSNYIGVNKKGYIVQVVECEANAFKMDCKMAAAEVWNLIDFE